VTGAEEYDVVGLESGEDVGLQVVVDGESNALISLIGQIKMITIIIILLCFKNFIGNS